MKYLLILLIAFPVLCKGQSGDSVQGFKKVAYCDTCAAAKVMNDTLFLPGRKELMKHDTLKIIMLMTDTSESSGTSLNGNGIVFWQIGYEVRTAQYVCCDPNDKLNASYYWAYAHFAYLDGDKKDLPKNIIVWQSKPL